MSHEEINIELKNIIEAALLVAGQPLTIKRMLAMFPAESQPSKDELRAVLKALDEEYVARGVELKQIGEGWRIQTRDKYAEYVARLMDERPPRYSRALLETLAIIAYRQPVTRGEIENIRGVAVSPDTIRTLLERGWVKQVGVREVPGRPALFGTTPAFLEHFSLKSLSDMPPLAELRSIEEIGAELDQRTNAPAESGNGADHSAEAAVSEEGVEPGIEATAGVEGSEENSSGEHLAAEAVVEPDVAAVVEAQAQQQE